MSTDLFYKTTTMDEDELKYFRLIKDKFYTFKLFIRMLWFDKVALPWLPVDIRDKLLGIKPSDFKGIMIFEDTKLEIDATNADAPIKAFNNYGILVVSFISPEISYRKIYDASDIIPYLVPGFFDVSSLARLKTIECNGSKCRENGDNGIWCESCNGDFIEEFNSCGHVMDYFTEDPSMDDLTEDCVYGAFFTQVPITDDNQLLQLLENRHDIFQSALRKSSEKLDKYENLIKLLPQKIHSVKNTIQYYEDTITSTNAYISKIKAPIEETKRKLQEEQDALLRTKEEQQRRETIRKKTLELQQLQKEIDNLNSNI